MNLTKKIGLIALLSSVSWFSQAANFNYNYGQIGYETGDFSGLTLTGSFEVNKDIFVIANFAALTNDDFIVDIDYDDFSIGAGYHMPVDAKTDAVFTVSFDSADASVIVPGFGKVSIDDTGILLTAGVRHNFNEKIELAGGIYHNTVFSGDTGIQAEARYNINKKMSAALRFSSGDVYDGLSINFRLGF